MVQHGRLRGSRAASVVVGGDSVEELRAHVGLERSCASLDDPEPEVDVPEQSSLLRLREERRAADLEHAADVVDERGGEEQVGAEPRVELRRLTAERRDADRVLE